MNAPRFLIVCTGWNCGAYVERCIESIKAQKYQHFKVILVDDGSDDDTFYKLDNNPHYPECVLTTGSNRGTYYARDYGISMMSQYYPDDFNVIALLDMDDALMPHALERVAQEYEKTNCWMTYGNWKDTRGKRCHLDLHYSDEVHENRNYRQDIFRCTHLRTFKKELYQAIPKWELTKAEINSYPDVEILFSMMEMCGRDNIALINEPLYIYNQQNPQSTLNRFGKDYDGYGEICARPKRELTRLL